MFDLLVLCFNSILVQLKDDLQGGTRASVRSFNSILVQLKVANIVNEVHVHKFQFNPCSIKRLSSRAICAAAKSVSIQSLFN